MLGRAFRNVALVAALALIAPAGLQAQTSIYFAGGTLIPISDFGDVADPGLMGIGGIGIGIGDTDFTVGAEGMYSPGNGSGTEPDVNLYSAMGWLEYEFGDDGSVSPYIFGGAGIIGGSEDGGNSDTEFGYQAGGGLAFPVGGSTSLFVEGRYMGSDSLDLIGLLAGLSIGLGG